MPLYSYSCEGCGTFEVQMGMREEHPDTAECPGCGGAAVRDIGADQRGRRKLGDIWPMVSDGAAIAPEQIAEYEAFDRMHGVATQYTPDGQPVLTGRKHRKAYCEQHGIFDRDGGYGDPQVPTLPPLSITEYDY